jgi:hypothetical protein
MKLKTYLHRRVALLCFGLVGLVSFGPMAACSAEDPRLAEPTDDLAHGVRCGANGGGDTCHPTCPCSAGRGDCDFDAECVAGLTCAADVGGLFGFGSALDICVPTHCVNGTVDSDRGEIAVDRGGPCGGCADNGFSSTCNSASCRCGPGWGDCDSDADCQTGLVCASDFGARFGLNAALDICVPQHCVDTGCGSNCGLCETSCTNGSDDDGDGLTDCWDPECPSCDCVLPRCGCDRDAIECHFTPGNTYGACQWAQNGVCQNEADLAFVTNVGARGPLLLRDGVLYATDGHDILGVDTTTRELKTLVSAINPDALAIDEDHIYWTNRATNTIKRAPRAGGVPEAFTPARSPLGLAVTNDAVYWTQGTGKQALKRRSKSRGPIETIWQVSSSSQSVGAVTADERLVVFESAVTYLWDGVREASMGLLVYDTQTSELRGLPLFMPIWLGGSSHPVLLDGNVYANTSYSPRGGDMLWDAFGLNATTGERVLHVSRRDPLIDPRGIPGSSTAKRGSDVYIGGLRVSECGETELIGRECAHGIGGTAVDEQFLYFLRAGSIHRVLR